MNKIQLLELLDYIDDDGEIYFVDQNNLYYAIESDLSATDGFSVYMKEQSQIGYVGEDIKKEINR